MTINLAIIGAGSIGAKHAEAARQAGLRIGCIIDMDQARAQTLAETYEAAYSDDISRAFRDRSIDAVIIGVPNYFHKSLSIAAMQAGKDVLLEKPMALNQAECREIIEVSQSTGRLVQMGFVHRYTAVGKLAREFTAEHRLGDIYHATGQIYFRRGVPGLGKWFTTKELSGGGALIDVGVHLLDLALYLMGFPEVADVNGQVHSVFGRRMQDYVYSHMWAGPPKCDGICDVEDSAHAFIRFRSGATLDLRVAWAGNFPESSLPPTLMGFFGDRGGMTFELFGDHIKHTYERSGEVVDETVSAPETVPFRDQLLDFAQSIKSREVRGATGRQGEIVQSIVDRIYRSSIPQLATSQA